MLLKESYYDLPMDDASKGSGVMRIHLFSPLTSSNVKLGALIVFTEIYQVSGPVARYCRKLSAELGLIVACPESYHEYEEPGTVLPYSVEGTDRGNELKITKPIEAFDFDAAAVVKYLQQSPNCNGRIGTVGMCLGGHLAFRCGMLPDVIAAACLFPTDIHSSSLGKNGCDSMTSMSKLSNTEVLLVWGKQDNHTSATGRAEIYKTLCTNNVDFAWMELNARHAFIRDELSKGRYDPALSSVVHAAVSELFTRRLVLGLESTATLTAQTSAPGPANC